jgi:YaiO family outer membrane protein
VTRRSSAPPFRSAILYLLACVALPAGARAQSAGAQAAPITRTVGVDYEYVYFEGDQDPWQLASLSLRQAMPGGSVIGRVNYGDQYGESGVQVEVDAYPRLGRSTYAYLNAGYAPSGFFPSWRFGGELYGNFAGGWEASAGLREMRFDSTSVTLLTGSVGKYVGNYWISLRPYVDPNDGSPTASASLTARRYFADADHYVGASVGYGETPPEEATAAELQRIASFTVGVQGSTGLRERLLGVWSGGFEREELAPDRFRQRWRALFGLRLSW